MANLDLAALRAHLETDLTDTPLQLLLDDSYAAIENRIGPEGEQTVTLSIRSTTRYVRLPRPIVDAADISEIIQRWGNSEETLETDEWRWVSGRTIERLVGSGNGDWVLWGWNFVHEEDVHFDLIVTYTPKDETIRRNRVAVDLVRLAIQNTGLKSESAGDYSSSAKEYQEERSSIIHELVPKVLFV